MAAAVKLSQATHGPIDILIPCAGSFHLTPSPLPEPHPLISLSCELAPGPGKAYVGHFTTVSGADHHTSMQLNYFGTLNVVRAVMPQVILMFAHR